MKVGILTLPLYTNYGGILQAYAMMNVLKKMGHEVWLIDKIKSPDLEYSQMPLEYTKRIIKKYFLRRPNTHIFREKYARYEFGVLSQFTEPFIEKHIPLRIFVLSPDDLEKNQFDAIIVGSDQIWRPKYYPKIENAFLNFTLGWDLKRISYAPSFGTDDWEYSAKQTKQCAELLKKFDAVSVRETSGVQLCSEKFGVDATHVLDPTMLVKVEDYIAIIENVQKSDGSLLTYILDRTPEKDAVVNVIKERNGYKSFQVNSETEDKNASLEDRIAPPIERWLRGFYDAEFVITDSFHACVFSIIFNKPFIVYGNENRGLARFKSLLSIFGLENRLISSTKKSIEVLENPINWGKVNEILHERRLSSLGFLENSLK